MTTEELLAEVNSARLALWLARHHADSSGDQSCARCCRVRRAVEEHTARYSIEPANASQATILGEESQ